MTGKDEAVICSTAVGYSLHLSGPASRPLRQISFEFSSGMTPYGRSESNYLSRYYGHYACGFILVLWVCRS